MDEQEVRPIRRPSPVDDAEIDRVVRQYVKFLFDLTAAFHRGDEHAREPLSVIEAEARRIGALFVALPGDPGYAERVRAGGLCRYHFGEEMMHLGPDPIAAGFFWLAGQCADASQALAWGDEEGDVLRRLERVVVDFVAVVGGVA